MQFHCIRHKLLTDFERLLCCTPQRKKSILNIIRYFAKWFIIFFCDKQFTKSPEVKISNLFVDISDRLILGVMSGEKANYVFFFGFSNIYIIQNWQLSPSYRQLIENMHPKRLTIKVYLVLSSIQLPVRGALLLHFLKS